MQHIDDMSNSNGNTLCIAGEYQRGIPSSEITTNHLPWQIRIIQFQRCN